MIRVFTDKEFLELYNQGMNDTEISRILKCSHATCTNARYRLKLDKNFKYSCKINKNKLQKLCEEGLTTKEIASYFGVSNKYISSKCLEWNFQVQLPRMKIKDITYEEEQVLLGLILGDGYLAKKFNGKTTGSSISFSHCLKQEDYALYKANILDRFKSRIEYRSQYDKRTKKTYYKISYAGNSHQILNQYRDLFYKNGKKTINKEIINKLDALGMAVWYMDDGTAGTQGGYYLSTNGFQISEVEEAVEAIKSKFGIENKVVLSTKNQPMIYFGIRNLGAKMLEDLIKPHIVPCMLYKIHKEGITIPKVNKHNNKKIEVFYKGNFLKEYESIRAASQDLKMDRKIIDLIVKGKNRKRRSYKTKDYDFKYK